MLKVVEEAAAAQDEIGFPTLDELAHQGARRMLVAALSEEVTAYIDRHKDEVDEQGHRVVVRNGKAKARHVTYWVAGSAESDACRCPSRKRSNASR